MLGLGISLVVGRAPAAVPPTIVGLNYTLGDPGGGGQSIVLTGTNLTSASVTIGGNAATVTANNASTVTFTLPAHAAGVVDVTVTTAGGSATSVGAFEYWSPASLSLTGWFRAPYTAPGSNPRWSGTASAGTSGTPTLVASTSNPPSAGAAVGGFAPASFNGTNQLLRSTTTFGTLLGSCVHGSVLALYKANNAAAPAAGGSPYLDAALFGTTGGGTVQLSVNSTGVRYAIYNGSAYVDPGSILASTGAWHLAQMKWDGSTLKGRVDGGAWSSTNTVGAADAGSVPNIGASYNSTTFFNGSILEIACAASALSDANFDKWRAYAQQRYGVTV